MKVHLPYLEFQIVDHCNVNCKGCTHFSPLVTEKWFYDRQKFYENCIDIEQKIAIPPPFTIRIMGGEPLLHPNVIEILEIVRTVFKGTSIHIVTNGTKLLNMSNGFFETLRLNNIIVDISQYPILKNIENITCFLKSVGVKYRIKVKSKMFAMLNPFSLKDSLSSYKSCPLKKAILVRNGRLYKCATSALLGFYNKTFSTSIPVETGINVHEMSSDEIIKTCYYPNQVCKYCDFDNKKIFTWKFSKRHFKEWLCCNVEGNHWDK